MRWVQMEIFSVVGLAWLRDSARRRNYSTEKELFRRAHGVRRAFGKALHHAARMRRDAPEARTPDGKLRWIEAMRADFREANKRRAHAEAEFERYRKRATGDLFKWGLFANRWRVKYAAAC